MAPDCQFFRTGRDLEKPLRARCILPKRGGHAKAVLGLAILLASFCCAFALDPSLQVSQYAHRAWKIRDGFTRGTINDIAQTPDGYLWLGTEFGLYRFDGVRAVPWPPQKGEQLPGNSIETLLVARDGTLWIGTPKGLAGWKNGKLTQSPEVAGRRIGPLVEDDKGTIWFGVQEPGQLCAFRDGKVQCYGVGSFGNSVIALYEDRKRNLWVSAQTGIWRWAPGSPNHYRFSDKTVQANSLIEDDSGAFLMCTAILGGNPTTAMSSIEGLKQLVGGEIRNYTLPGGVGQFRPTRLFRSWDGSLWIGSVQGLLHVHQGRVDRFAAHDGLSGDVVRSIFEDREGTVWVSTQDGLDQFRELAVPTISRNQGLSNSAAYVVQAAPDGSIWIATADGLDRWEKGQVTVYGGQKTAGRTSQANQANVTTSAKVTEIANSGLAGDARSLGLDDRGRVWASTNDGIFYFERDRFMPVPGVPGGNTFAIAGDSHGNVWISNAEEGLFSRTPGGAVQQIPWMRFGQQHAAVALLPDRLQGGLWLGFLDGGIAYLKDGQIRASYSVAGGLGGGRVNNLQQTSDGAVWAATDGGLSRVKDGHVATLSNKNGLPCDAVHWAMEDNDHSFWLYMPCGLVRISSSELDGWITDSKRVVQTTFFDSSDGVRSRSTAGRYGPKVTRAADGKLWFAALDGVSVIDPRHLSLNKIPPPLHIEKITADDKTYDVSNGMRLGAQIRNLDIDYTALSLVVPEKVRFRVKLEGEDKDWRELVNVRHVEYTNLPPKHYRFRVLACNNSGVWNEEGASLDFVIPPAWYQTNWFRAACVAAFLALLWAAYQLRVRQLAYQFNMRLEERVAERTRVARDLHDTLLQSFQALLPRLQAGINMFATRPADALRTLEQAADQASQAIAEGRDAIQGMRMSTVEKNDLAVAIRTVGEELASAATKPPSPNFHVVVEGTSRNLHPILRDEVYRLAVEALRNAFRHAAAQNVEVEIRYDAKYFRLRVRDDGKGIPSDVLSGDGREGHYGLPGMRERAKLVGGKLTIWTELDGGTEIELNIPGARAFVKSARPFWQFGKRSAREPDEKETIERE